MNSYLCSNQSLIDMQSTTLTAPQFKYAEQSLNSAIVTLILDNGVQIDVLETKLLEFIEKEDLNLEKVFAGNSSWDSDPCHDEYEEIEIPVEKYLDNNFDEVCKLYYNKVINK